MKKKNLKHYRSAFSHIDEDQFNRIQNYLKENPLNKNQVQKFKEAILTHKEYSSWVTIVFYAIPEPTPRPKFGNSRFYVKNSDSNRTFMNKFYSLEQANLPHITGECALDLDLYFPIPKSFNRVDTLLAEIGMLRPAKRPDWDNLGKTYSDMIQPYILEDDGFIVDSTVRKFYSLKPRIEITLRY